MKALALSLLAAVCVAALPSGAVFAAGAAGAVPELLKGTFDPALPEAMRQRALDHPRPPMAGCVQSDPATAAKTAGWCHSDWSRNDTAPFLYGDTFVVHIFVTDDDAGWQTSSWWPWDWTRETAAATARDAVEWIEDKSPDDMDVSFSIAGSDSFYYYNATVSGVSAWGDDASWTYTTVPAAIGYGDWDGDGAMMDELLEAQRTFARRSGTWDNVIAIIHVNHNGRSHAWPHLAACINYAEYDDWNTYAHETMHLYGASDEYEDSKTLRCGGGYCNETYTNEWLETNYVNGNCEKCGPDHHCVMLNQWDDDLMICDWTKGHIGWRDDDADGHRDLEVSRPWADITVPPPALTGSTSVSLLGRAYNAWRWSPITAVEYRVNGGGWQNATASDGSWNDPQENFQIVANLPGDGDYDIEVRAKNSMTLYQNCDYALGEVHVDLTGPPAPAVTSTSHPSQTTWYPNRNLQVSWTEPYDIGGVSGYSYVWDRNAATVPDTNVDTTGRTASVVATGDDIHYFHVRAVDGFGNWGPTAHRTLKHDNTAPDLPVIVCTTHPADTWCNAGLASFSWSSGDSTSGVRGYVWSAALDQDDDADMPALNPQATTSRSYGLQNLPDGEHFFHVRAVDWAGNWTATAHRRILVDREAPALSAESTTHSDPSLWYANDDVTYQWTFTKTDWSGITGYSYAHGSYDPSITPDTTSEGTSNTVTYNNLASGIWWFGVHGRDGANNWGGDPDQQGIVRVSARVDVTDPGLVDDLASPSHYNAIGEYDCVQSSDRTVEVTWSEADDSHSGIEGYSICWNQEAGTGPDAVRDLDATVTSAVSAPLADGESWYFHIRSKDAAGNWDDEFATLGPFYIDATPPLTPTNLVADAGNGAVDLRWRRVASSMPITYSIYRRVEGGSFASPIAEDVQDSTYTDAWPSAENGEIYHYAVAAVDSCGREGNKSVSARAEPEYVSPGDGRRWDLTDLVNNSMGGVRGSAPSFTMHGEVILSAGDTLDVDPGHALHSQDSSGEKRLVIRGVLYAAGTAAQTITFDASTQAAGSWGGLRLESPGAGSVIGYCEIRYAALGVDWSGGSPTVGHSTIEKCSGRGIAAVAAPVPGSTCLIRGNTVRWCGTAGIDVFGSPFATTQVDSNTVRRNGTGITYSANPGGPAPASLMISDNDVRNQTGDGISCGQGAQNITISGNTVFENWDGIVFKYEGFALARPLITFNNVSGNRNAGIYTSQQASPIVQSNRIAQNITYGCYSTTDATPTLMSNTITGSKYGIYVTQSPNAVPDAGNPPASPGQNSMDGHSIWWIWNGGGVVMNAKSNDWGSAQANPGLVIAGTAPAPKVRWNPVWNAVNQPPTITLTAPVGGAAEDTVGITWIDGDPDPLDNATINLFYDTDGAGLDGTPVDGASNLSEDDPANRYTWDTRFVPAGTYYVYGMISDAHEMASSYAQGSVTIQHPDIAVLPDTLRADVRPGNTGGQVLRIRNAGTAALSGSLDAGAGWLSFSDTTFAVATGESLDVTVWFDAASLGEGDYASLVGVAGNDHADSLVTVPALMHVAEPEIEVSAASLAFGGVPVDSTSERDIEVRNIGSGDLVVISLTIDGDFSVSGASPPEIVAPGDTLTLTVTYDPETAAADASTLSIASDDADEGTVDVPLSGTGLGPEARPDALSHAFGTVAVGDSALWTLGMHNDGTTTLVLSSASFDSSGFALLSPSLAATVAAGDSLELALAFVPGAARTYDVQLTVATNDPDEEEIVIALSGTGAYPQAALAGGPIAFGSVTVGAASDRTLRVRNLGADTLSVIEAATSPPFSVTAPSFPADVGPGDSLAVTVRYAPPETGGDSAGLFVTTDDPASPTLDTSLSGTGVAPEVSLSASFLDFGIVHADSARTLAFVARNEGTSALTVSALALASGLRFDADAPATPFEIAAGDSEVIEVTFLASPVDAYADTLTIACDDADEALLDVALAAESAAPEVAVHLLWGHAPNGNPLEYDVTGGSCDLGSCRLGNSASRTFRVRNTGGYPMRITQASASPAAFAASGIVLPATVPAGEFAAVAVTFTPAATGSAAGTLTLGTNDRETPVVTVTLDGEGTDAVAALQPDSLGTLLFENTSTDLWLQLTNSGTAEYGYLLREESGAGKRSALSWKEQILARPEPAPKAAELAWLSVADSTGFVAGGDTVAAAIHLDAGPVGAGAYAGAVMVFTSDADMDTTSIPVTLRVPSMRFADHDGANFLFTVTDEGALGYWDAVQAHVYGTGFVYPKSGGVDYLFSGSVWIGTSSSQVSDASYDYDFDVVPGSELSVAGSDPERSFSRCRDTSAPSPIGVEVEQEGLAYPASAYDDFLVLNFILRNVSGAPIEGLRAGLYLDWDVRGGAQNEGGYNAPGRAGYMYNATQSDSTHVGIVMIRPSVPSAFRLIHHPTYVYPYGTVRDVDKWTFLASGTFDLSTWERQDWSMVMCAGPFDLGVGESVPVSFAVAAGVGRQAFLANADAARDLLLTTVPREAPPARFALHANRPNPFESVTQLVFDLPERTAVRVAVYDVRGRLVRRLADRAFEAGVHTLSWDGRDDNGRRTPTGIYFCRVDAAGETAARKIVRLNE
jgi:hypothetical protein